jgi:hypothetical protein
VVGKREVLNEGFEKEGGAPRKKEVLHSLPVGLVS